LYYSPKSISLVKEASRRNTQKHYVVERILLLACMANKELQYTTLDNVIEDLGETGLLDKVLRELILVIRKQRYKTYIYIYIYIYTQLFYKYIRRVGSRRVGADRVGSGKQNEYSNMAQMLPWLWRVELQCSQKSKAKVGEDEEIKIKIVEIQEGVLSINHSDTLIEFKPSPSTAPRLNQKYSLYRLSQV
jgi:hypothetical protein